MVQHSPTHSRRTRNMKEQNSKQIIRSRHKAKAISPIIATLLLILIAIAAGVVVYAYVIGFVGSTTGGSQGQNTQLSSDLVAIKASTGVTTLVLKNVGGTSAVLGSGLYLKGGTLTTVVQQGWRVTLTSTSGAPTQITDIQVKQAADNSHVTIQITQASGTVTYTATVFGTSLSCTIAISASTTGSCGTNIALPTGVTVSTGYVADTGAITVTPASATLTNFGVSTSAGAGAGTLTMAPGTTAEMDLFAVGGTATALSSGNTYTVQVTANDGSTFTINAKAA
jgi:flagellin-like protein